MSVSPLSPIHHEAKASATVTAAIGALCNAPANATPPIPTMTVIQNQNVCHLDMGRL